MVILDVGKKSFAICNFEDVIKKALKECLSEVFSERIAEKYKEKIYYSSIDKSFIIYYNDKFYRIFEYSVIEMSDDEFIPNVSTYLSEDSLIKNFVNTFDFKAKLVATLSEATLYEIDELRIRISGNSCNSWFSWNLDEWADSFLKEYFSDKVIEDINDKLSEFFEVKNNIITNLIIENDCFELYLEDKKLKLRKIEDYKEKLESIIDEACNFSIFDEVYGIKTLLLNLYMYAKQFVEPFRILELRNGDVFGIGEVAIESLRYKFFSVRENYYCEWISFPIKLNELNELTFTKHMEQIIIDSNNIEKISKALKELNIPECNLIDSKGEIFSFNGECLQSMLNTCKPVEANLTLAVLKLNYRKTYK